MYITRSKSAKGCMVTIVVIILLLIICSTVFSQVKNEKYFQKIAAKELNGTIEYVLFDKSRVDIVTFEYAIEVDYCYKWSESIGQSIYYSLITKKKPAIIMIYKGFNDYVYIKRVTKVCQYLGIRLYMIDYNSERFSLLL